eukprot:scaffold154660_cov56-Attheya_sp.AAC.5
MESVATAVVVMALTTERSVKKEDKNPTDKASPMVKIIKRRHFKGDSRLARSDAHMNIHATVDKPNESIGTIGTRK